MGSFIVQQPNGLYARFSTVVDCVTDYNMTKDDYISLKMEEAKNEAEYTLEHHLKPYGWIDKYFAPNNMTVKEFEEIKQEMERR